jgi:hypothetical protein
LSAPQWFLLGTQCGNETSVERALRVQGYKTFVPRDTEGALFPGYLFCQLGDEDTEGIRRKRGVHIVKFGTRPATISDVDITDLQSTEWHRSSECQEGSKVRTNDLAGAYRNQIGIIKSKGRGVFALEIQMATGPQVALVPIKAVEAV